MFTAFIASVSITLCAVIGALFLGRHKRLEGIEVLIIPFAVGVFLSLAFYGMIPHVLEASPEWGGFVVGAGFIIFYIVAYLIHRELHHRSVSHCEEREAAILILIGDALHNFADGVLLGGAFLVSPEVGIVTAAAIALHEIPQEIVEFGVLIRGGFSRGQALFWNLISASTVILGTMITMILSSTLGDLVWVLSALAAGNLLYIAASDLLPRLHSSAKQYGGFAKAATFVLLGFIFMTVVLYVAHEKLGHDHEHEHEHEAALEHSSAQFEGHEHEEEDHLHEEHAN